jgi:hypothetical protein
MRRGRPATKGVDDAVAIARKRGFVMRIEYGPENICDLIIRTALHLVVVRVRRMDTIAATLPEIEHACRTLIAELRLFPVSAQIELEIWLYSRHGTFRFFRINGTGLIEIARDGEPAGQPPGQPETGETSEVPKPDDSLGVPEPAIGDKGG